MSKELVISASRHETRVAILEDDQLVEVYHQREQEYSLAGSIHKGRVTRVLPGMQSAFVDIGLERDAFLYVSDFFEDNDEYDKVVTSVEEKVLKLDRTGAPVEAAPIVQAIAEPAEVVEPVAAPSSEIAAAPVTPTTAVSAPPQPGRDGREPRGDRGGDRGDRDRGHRGRRRRGGRGGRGLPDSKFYSPREEADRPAATPVVEPVGVEPVVEETAAQADDFFVLPGESLAKYTRGGEEGEQPETEQAEQAEQDFTEQVLTQVEETVAAAEPEPEAVEVAAVTAEEPEAAAVAPEPAPVVEPEPEPEPVVETAPEPVAETAVEAVAEAAPEEAADEPSVEAVAEEAETEEEISGEAGEEGEPELIAEGEGAVDAAVEGEAGAPITEEEGPEPARIPTSLTAALREQNARYPHRMSRRMRRRGGRGQQDQPPQQQREPRPPQAEPQQRTAAPRQEVAARPEKSTNPSISDLLREGQEIIVQIAKEPLGQKGARITSHIALPGRFLVYMPTVDHIGVSRKIPSDDERTRLKRVLQNNRTGISGGFIVRTAGEGHTEEELRADMHFLYNMWLDMRAKAEKRPAPVLIHHDLNVVERVLRDQLTASFKSIWVDNEELYESVLRFVQRFQPTLVARVKLYTRNTPIFDEFGITQELEKALRPKVWLKSGGYIVINQTEALVAIDINTGKYVGKSNRLEDTIVKTNTDAIREIVRQIRLRDLGGIIVVDFIDMDERKNRQKVMQALEESMRADRAPYKILQFNDFGLVAITRKRVKQSLERTLCTPCPYCEGAGYVKSPQTVVGEILQEAHKIAKLVEGKDVMLRVNPEVARLLKSNQNSFLQELEEVLGRTVIVKGDHQLHQEKFDLA
jgi:ribonuclease G